MFELASSCWSLTDGPNGTSLLEPTMSLPHTAAEVLRKHVTLELECMDRLYLNVYVPLLQSEGGPPPSFVSTVGTSLLPLP